jgi:hypothetical protein
MYKYVLYRYKKMFRNPFAILVIHKFCYFNLVISPLYCNIIQTSIYDSTIHDRQGIKTKKTWHYISDDIVPN